MCACLILFCLKCPTAERLKIEPYWAAKCDVLEQVEARIRWLSETLWKAHIWGMSRQYLQKKILFPLSSENGKPRMLVELNLPGHHGIFKVWMSMLWHPLAWFPLLLFSFPLLMLEISVLVQANHLLRDSERAGIRGPKEISSYPKHCTQTGLTLNPRILFPLCSSCWCGLEYIWSFCLVDNNVVGMNQT